MKYRATLSDDRYTADIAEDAFNAELESEVNVYIVPGKRYGGKTTVTPSMETQTLETAGLVLDTNVIVNPIPSNYGLISWDGSVLTVS